MSGCSTPLYTQNRSKFINSKYIVCTKDYAGATSTYTCVKKPGYRYFKNNILIVPNTIGSLGSNNRWSSDPINVCM